jgi:hypothetical protein
MALGERVYSINHFKTESIVELTWLPGTQGMTDQDFKEDLCVFAEAALQHRANCLIIDMRQFMGRPSAEVGAWRDDVIVPKYEKAGVKKMPGFGPACLATRWGKAPLINNATLRRAIKRSIGAWRAANPLGREFAGAEA